MPALAKKQVREPLESDILNAVRERLAMMNDIIIYRNNVGVLKDSRGIPVRYGLSIGSCDLIGSLTVNIGGMRIARALAIEVKRPGQKPTAEQVAWMENAIRAGWVVGVVTSVTEAEALVETARVKWW